MTEQIEQLNKMKNKVEKDKTLIMREIADASAAVDELRLRRGVAAAVPCGGLTKLLRFEGPS